jgi:hypothetical protein
MFGKSSFTSEKKKDFASVAFDSKTFTCISYRTVAFFMIEVSAKQLLFCYSDSDLSDFLVDVILSQILHSCFRVFGSASCNIRLEPIVAISDVSSSSSSSPPDRSMSLEYASIFCNSLVRSPGCP